MVIPKQACKVATDSDKDIIKSEEEINIFKLVI